MKLLEGGTLDVPQLWLGDHLLANCFVSMDWWHDPVQFTVCACGHPGCVGGDYFSLRRTGELVIFLPAFALWEDEFYIDEYANRRRPMRQNSGHSTLNTASSLTRRKEAMEPNSSTATSQAARAR